MPAVASAATLSPYAGTTRAITPWIATYSTDCGNALDVGQGPSAPIHFSMVPGHFQGGIIVSKMFDTPVDTFSFHYSQNWHNAWMIFEVWAYDSAGNRKRVKYVDTYGGWSEDVSLSGLNTKRIEVSIWTKKTGDLSPGDVANWYCDLSNINWSCAGWQFVYSNDCGSGLDVGSSSAVPVHFVQRPGHFVGGIIAVKDFAVPIDTFSFHYSQNWSTAWMFFEAWATDASGSRRRIKLIEKTGAWSEDVKLTDLDAKRIEVLVWTKQVADLGSDWVSNWFCDVSNPAFIVDTSSAVIDSVNPSPAVLGQPVALTGHGTDSVGDAITAYNWRSSIDGQLSTAASFSTSSLSAGTHTIYFKVQCSGGVWSLEQQTTLVVVRPTSLALSSSHPAPAAGDPVTISGSLTSLGAAIAGATVKLQSSLNGTTWTDLATLSTDSSGAFSRSVTPLVKTWYRAVFAGDSTRAASSYAVTIVTPVLHELAMTFSASNHDPHMGTSVALSGSLTDAGTAVSGVSVKLQSSGNGTTWMDLSTLPTTGSGAFSQSVTPTAKTWYRAVFAGDATRAASTSGVLIVTPRWETKATWDDTSVRGVRYGSRVVLQGILRRSDGAAGPVSAQFSVSVAGGSTRTYTVTASPSGHVSFRVSPASNATVRLRVQGGSEYLASGWSAPITVHVRPVISTPKPSKKSIGAHGKTVIRVTTRPARPGSAKIKLNVTGPKTNATAAMHNKKGSWYLTFTAGTARGVFTFRASVGASSRYAAARSSTCTVRVR